MISKEKKILMDEYLKINEFLQLMVQENRGKLDPLSGGKTLLSIATFIEGRVKEILNK